MVQGREAHSSALLEASSAAFEPLSVSSGFASFAPAAPSAAPPLRAAVASRARDASAGSRPSRVRMYAASDLA